MSRSNAAVKANRTRAARRNFREKYPDTWEIARDLWAGKDTEDVAYNHNVSMSTVAAVLANLNREGQFSDMATACNF